MILMPMMAHWGEQKLSFELETAPGFQSWMWVQCDEQLTQTQKQNFQFSSCTATQGHCTQQAVVQ